jgi:zinc/manganese transport system ATP-binding protein
MHAIELNGLALKRGERTVLSGVEAVIEDGEFIGIFGPNGSGKTTLLHAILGLIKPAAGTIRVFGRPTNGGNPAVGYLPQKRGSLGDLPLRGRDFVASAIHGERWGLPIWRVSDRAEIARVLDLVDAAHLAERPLGQLSGGEQQRLLLAKALIGQPKLLLLDEPLMSLDPRFQSGVVALVRDVQKELGLTVLFTAHELNPLLGAMDRVLYLGNGGAAIGPVDQVVTDDVLSRLYDTPIEVLRVNGRIIVVTALGAMDADVHHHHP